MRIQLPQVELARSKYAVVFDPETLAVTAVRKSRNLPESLSYTEVEFDEVQDIIEGKESIRSKRVFYDLKTETYKLVKNTDDSEYKLSELIYKVPKKHYKNAEIQVIQDIPNSCWKIHINDSLKKRLTSAHVNVNIDMCLSVTEENNPNILYRMLKFSLRDLIQKSSVVFAFVNTKEFTAESASIYTVQRFDSYSYEVINE